MLVESVREAQGTPNFVPQLGDRVNIRCNTMFAFQHLHSIDYKNHHARSPGDLEQQYQYTLSRQRSDETRHFTKQTKTRPQTETRPQTWTQRIKETRDSNIIKK